MVVERKCSRLVKRDGKALVLLERFLANTIVRLVVVVSTERHEPDTVVFAKDSQRVAQRRISMLRRHLAVLDSYRMRDFRGRTGGRCRSDRAIAQYMTSQNKGACNRPSGY